MRLSVLVAAAAAVAAAAGGAEARGNPSWVLPLAPAAYGGPGVINPYSNVNPLNPMAAQMQQQAAAGAQGGGQAGNSGALANAQNVVNGAPPGGAGAGRGYAFVEAQAEAGEDATLSKEAERLLMSDDEVYELLKAAEPRELLLAHTPAPEPPAFDFRELARLHSEHTDAKEAENEAANNVVVPGAQEPGTNEAAPAHSNACDGCTFVASTQMVAQPAAAASDKCTQCPAEARGSCSCASTHEVRTTVLKPNGTKTTFIETAETSCGCSACPCEKQYVTPELKADHPAAAAAAPAACGCSSCPCEKQYVKPELKDEEKRLGPCDCADDDENCKCRLRQQRLADAKERAESKYLAPQYVPNPHEPKTITVEPERAPCGEGCKRHEETGECSCNTVEPEIKDDCPCHAQPECGCRRPVTNVVRTDSMATKAKNGTAPAAAEQKK